ncbi:HAD-IC family P-type ATPase [Nocardia otitidiscaviarum]|uniref:HAD-IC family P-type ATPase n=1 Tax=Nocardia otitidiscaviarum TaxID=1823 RepID=UPI000693FECE|nr:HAD-IC family P-type ATPase [Nocardia otitidiscaviarum]MBF6488364.1 HAD-IC family P-type ATPase [Nocardia otitidiscaviarum]
MKPTSAAAVFGVGAAVRFVTALAGDTVRAVRNEAAGRQIWARDGRAHIEARGVHHVDAPADYPAALRSAVGALDGVRWVAVNGILGDVIVDFDPERVNVARLSETVAHVEHEYAMTGRPRDRPLHPASFEPIFDELVALGGDLAGAVVGLVGRLAPTLSLPPESIAAVHAVDLIPGLRTELDSRFGAVRVDAVLSLAGSAVSAASRNPLSALADAGLRAVELPAALARRHAWERRAAQLTATARAAAAQAQPAPDARPTPLPPGPVQRYERKAGAVTVSAAALLLPVAGLTRAARAIVIGAPRAADMGAAAYTAALARTLCDRGVLVRDPAALALLDRIDTVVIDAQALVDAEGRLDPLTDAVMAAAHRVGHVVVAPRSSGLAERVGANDSLGGGPHLAASVRELQAQGHTVALIAGHNAPGLAAADCAIGILTDGRTPPWAADILCGPGLSEAWLLLRGCGAAGGNSARGVRLALLGSISGAVLGLLGPQRGACQRGTFPVGLAALAAVATGIWSVGALARQAPPAPSDSTPWHALPVDEALAALGTGLPGLTEQQAAQRRTAPTDTAEPAETLWRATLSELDTPLTAPLAAGAGVSAASGSVFDAGLVSLVMMGNALLGAVQRTAAGRAVRRLAESGSLQARLRRQERESITPASELVVGDIVVLRAGDAVPADCRLLRADHLEVDESSLTGESLPVPKDPAPVDAAEVAERASMLYAGTDVVAGSGTAVVVAVGAETETGRSGRLADSGESASGVAARLDDLTRLSMRVSVGAATAVLGIGLLRGRLSAAVGSAVALGVAAVPEGLPFVATVAQLAAARRLSTRNVLVRTPRTLEALGRVDTVCFDKTGTLTEGHIRLRRVGDGTVDEAVDALTGARRDVLAAALRATPVGPEGQPLPHPTDRAVVRGAAVAAIERDHAEPDWIMVQELPSNPVAGSTRCSAAPTAATCSA